MNHLSIGQEIDQISQDAFEVFGLTHGKTPIDLLALQEQVSDLASCVGRLVSITQKLAEAQKITSVDSGFSY